MKKLIAMVMTAAMVASLVPATAFAGGSATATAKIVDALELTKTEARTTVIDDTNYPNKVPELVLTIQDEPSYSGNEDYPTTEVTLELDNAEWKTGNTLDKAYFDNLVTLKLVQDTYTSTTRRGWKEDVGGTDYVLVAEDRYNQSAKTVKPADVSATLSDLDEILNFLDKYDNLDYSLVTSATAIKIDSDATTVFDGTDWLGDYVSSKLDGFMEDIMDGTIAFSDISTGNDQIEVTSDTKYTAATTLDNVTSLSDTEQKAALTNAGYALCKWDTISSVQDTERDSDDVWLDSVKDSDDDEATLVFKGKFLKGDKIFVKLESELDKNGEGKTATVSVDGDLCTVDDMVYVSVLGYGITASTKKLTTIAVEEKETMEKDLVIKSTVGKFANGQTFELRLSSGFEFSKADRRGDYVFGTTDENVVTLTWDGPATDEIKINGDDIGIEAVSAKIGAIATMTVKTTNNFKATAKVEVAKVVDYVVEMTVDEDEDVPVIYSGVDKDNTGITDDSDHLSLEVTIEESFFGAWDFNKAFNLELPEGVYVTNVDVLEADNFEQQDSPVGTTEWNTAFKDAYKNGDHENFEFKKRVFDNVDTDSDEAASLTFQLELVADPTFEGDVTLKLTGDAFGDGQEVKIAKFVKPYEVKAEQNDLKIDYRYTEIPTEITVTEAEGGLWDKGAEFAVYVEKPGYIVFEDDPTFTVDKDSGLELDKDELVSRAWDGGSDKFDAIHFTVDKTSDEAATVTISDLSLFMDRTIPAGAYALKGWTSMAKAYEAQTIFNPAACGHDYVDGNHCTSGTTTVVSCDKIKFVGDVCDYSKTVKEAFVNVVTAGREQDDASFTTKVVVPVGESKIMAGEVEYTIDAPAYINANGYTMLPVRAVAVALGINNNNVLWDQATKTVTILYGQRIITMQVGASVVYVNGAALPASSSVEITNNRTFLGLRDLATALGVTDITWDASTKTATLNGGNTAE